MPYFGLTGGVASGKSTVSRIMEEFGAKIIDADRLGHELIRRPRPAYQETVETFGSGILNATGEIDRRILGEVVFADPSKLQKLNRILHPRISVRVEELALEYAQIDKLAVTIVDAALIFEAGIGARFEKIIVTWCRPEQQLARLMAKSDLSREQAMRRILAQMPVDEKRRRADYQIDCSGSLEETRAQAEAVWTKLRARVAATGSPAPRV